MIGVISLFLRRPIINQLQYIDSIIVKQSNCNFFLYTRFIIDEIYILLL